MRGIKQVLDVSLDSSYWIVAEIGEMRIHSSKHCYLELIEKKETEVLAKVKATIWAYEYKNIEAHFKKITGSPLRQGIKILTNIQVTFHEVYGLSLSIKYIDASFTIGEREKNKQEVVEKLQKNGLLELNKQIPLPFTPQKIALISSSTAAGYDDFIKHIQQNGNRYQLSITFFETVMQGKDSINSITQNLNTIQNKKELFDIIAIVRGGGAQMDMDNFNDYDLCSTLCKMQIPVFTGIGHERDQSIADIVAHTSFKTPTAVAQFIIDGCMSFEGRLEYVYDKIYQSASRIIQDQHYLMQSIYPKIQQSAQENLYQNKNKIYFLENTIFQKMSKTIQMKKNRINIQENTLLLQTKQTIQNKKNRIDTLEKIIQNQNPMNILKKGYSITKPLKNITLGSTLQTRTIHYTITSTITDISNEKQ